MKLSFLFIILSSALFLNAQTNPPNISWQKSFGSYSDEEEPKIIKTFDGCMVIIGTTSSINGMVSGNHGSRDFWIIKINQNRNLIWQKCLGGSGDDYSGTIIQTKDSGFVAVGSSKSNDGNVSGHHGTNSNRDAWIAKLDSSGNIQWENSYGGTQDDEVKSIYQCRDGGYIVACNSYSNDGDVSGHHGTINYSDNWIMKIDSVGNIQWEHSFGGSYNDTPYSIQQTKDNGFFVVGTSSSLDGDITNNHGNNDAWILKLNSFGSLQWQHSLGGSNYDQAISFVQTKDNGYAIACGSSSNDGDVSNNHNTGGTAQDYWFIKLDSLGSLQYQKCFGGTDEEVPFSLKQTMDSGFIMAGLSSSFNGDVTSHHGSSTYPLYDYWVVKTDSLGNLLWEKCLGGSSDDLATDIIETSLNEYVVAGYSYSNDGDVTLNNGSLDFWIVKLGPTPVGIKGQKMESDISIYPNPSQGTINVEFPEQTLSIEVFNSTGQQIEKQNTKHQTKTTFNINEEGLYMLRIITGSEIITRKVVVGK